MRSAIKSLLHALEDHLTNSCTQMWVYCPLSIRWAWGNAHLSIYIRGTIVFHATLCSNTHTSKCITESLEGTGELIGAFKCLLVEDWACVCVSCWSPAGMAGRGPRHRTA